MTQVYPIFTDGNDFYHSDKTSPNKCRFAYFSELKLEEWTKQEKPKLTKEQAKQAYEKWEKE